MARLSDQSHHRFQSKNQTMDRFEGIKEPHDGKGTILTSVCLSPDNVGFLPMVSESTIMSDITMILNKITLGKRESRFVGNRVVENKYF